MKKKILATALAALMVSVCCLGASANTHEEFGGTTSGGTKGTMYLDCEMAINDGYAYSIFVGYVTNDSTDYTIFVRGTITGTLNGQSFSVTTPHTTRYNINDGQNHIVKGDRMIAGYSDLYPPEGYTNNVYTRASAEVGYQSADYGMWHFGHSMAF